MGEMTVERASAQGSPQGSPGTPRIPQPLRSRWILVALLPIIGFISMLMWDFASYSAADAFNRAFQRGPVGSTLSVTVHPGTWFVYDEGMGGATVRVIDQSGNTVPLGSAFSLSIPLIADTAPVPIASFEVPIGGLQEWRVESNSPTRDGQIAVGDVNLVAWALPQQIGSQVLFVVLVATAILIAVVPAVRFRRMRTASSDQGSGPAPPA